MTQKRNAQTAQTPALGLPGQRLVTAVKYRCRAAHVGMNRLWSIRSLRRGRWLRVMIEVLIVSVGLGASGLLALGQPVWGAVIGIGSRVLLALIDGGVGDDSGDDEEE